MRAGLYDLTIEAGATFNLSLTYEDERGQAVDLTGYTGRMQLRESATAATVVIELTTANGRLSIDIPNGQINLTVAAADTTGLSGSGVYDLELVNGTVVERLIEGTYTISPNVTR